LLAADDVGKGNEDPCEPKPRARQNVVFELGYFIGKLGRSRVWALHDEGVELPTDFHGVVCLPLDPPEIWKVGLVRELTVAGPGLDANGMLGIPRQG